MSLQDKFQKGLSIEEPCQPFHHTPFGEKQSPSDKLLGELGRRCPQSIGW